MMHTVATYFYMYIYKCVYTCTCIYISVCVRACVRACVCVTRFVKKVLIHSSNFSTLMIYINSDCVKSIALTFGREIHLSLHL